MCAGAEPERFDHVVIATHADQALAMLGDATRASASSWARSRTSRTRRFCIPTPACYRGGARVGELELPPARRPRARTTVTYHLNRLQRLERQQFCVTLNLTDRDRPGACLRGSITRTRSTRRRASTPQRRMGEISGRDAPTSAGPTGAGDFTRMGSTARCGSPRLGVQAVSTITEFRRATIRHPLR